jgi:hypothetical protein
LSNAEFVEAHINLLFKGCSQSYRHQVAIDRLGLEGAGQIKNDSWVKLLFIVFFTISWRGKP